MRRARLLGVFENSPAIYGWFARFKNVSSPAGTKEICDCPWRDFEIRITDHERGQMLNYLRITKLRVGLILNFKNARLEFERMVL